MHSLSAGAWVTGIFKFLIRFESETVNGCVSNREFVGIFLDRNPGRAQETQL